MSTQLQRLLCWGLAVFFGGVALAGPVVPAFERFHAGKPSPAGGRLLYNELGCVNCHGGSPGLPERRGPVLAGVTQRLDSGWIRDFLLDPARVRPGTGMPRLLEAGQEEVADALVQYLASIPSPKSKGSELRHVNAEHGRELFHSVGCVACHAPAPDYRPAEGRPGDGEFSYPSVLFPDLPRKWGLKALAEFLIAPDKVRPGGRMPGLMLDQEAAVDLAGYLTGYSGSDGRGAPEPAPVQLQPGMVEKGRDWARRLGCASCHEMPGVEPPLVRGLRGGDGRCLEGSGPVRYGLEPVQRAALKEYLGTPGPGGGWKQTASDVLEVLNCAACHDRDGMGGPDAGRRPYFTGDENLGDTGRYPPPLTGVGRKLRPEWLEGVFAGKHRVRPYLKTRMPVYPGWSGPLRDLLVAADRGGKPVVQLPQGEDTAGRKLLGTQGGLGCITCHRWGDRPSLGIQGMDISTMGHRLEPDWLREYLVHPAGYRPGTLMPSFWPEGKAANPETLGGDTARQIGAIYGFAKSANGEPEGFPERGTSEFELIPKERPLVQRTFLEGVGTHAILVGNPGGTHFAVDGRSGEVVLVWAGRFFDAYQTWFSRFAPFEKPLGDVLWGGTPRETQGQRFDGYRLDADGVPVFLRSAGSQSWEERIEPRDGGLLRRVSWKTGAAPGLRHPDGVRRSEKSGPGWVEHFYQKP